MIQTQGHSVGAMPQVQPVNPALYAFNPQALQQGALGTLGIAESLEKLKSLRQQTEELAKTEAARAKLLKAQADAYEADAIYKQQTNPSKIGLEIGKAESGKRLLPSSEKLLNAQADAYEADATYKQRTNPSKIGLAIDDADSKRRLIPSIEAAEGAKNVFSEKFAQTETSLLPQTGRLKALTMDLGEATTKSAIENQPREAFLKKTQTSVAQLEAAGQLSRQDFINETLRNKAELEAMISIQGIELAPEQLKALKRVAEYNFSKATSLAELQFAKAGLENMVLEAQAQSLVMRAKSDKSLETFQKIENLERSIMLKERDLESREVQVDGKNIGKLIDYIQKTRDEDGKIKKGRIFDPYIIPENEDMIKQIDNLRKRRLQLSQIAERLTLGEPIDDIDVAGGPGVKAKASSKPASTRFKQMKDGSFKIVE